MKAACLELLDILDEKYIQLKGYLDDKGEQVSHSIPGEGKWSAAMTVHHLMIAEVGGLAYCQKKLSFNPTLEEANPDQIKMESKLPYMLRSSKYKAVAPPGLGAEYLNNELPLEELFSEWKTQRDGLKQFIQNQPETLFSKALYKHPLAGKMRLQGMLMFFEGHLDSHTNQIKENYTSMGVV